MMDGDVVATGAVITDVDVLAEEQYAGLVTRGIAIAIDALLIDAAALIVTGAVLLVESVFRLSNGNHALAVAAGGVVFFAWVVGYFAAFWTTTGQTPGSRVMQIRVARPDGTRVGPARALLRLAGMVVSLPLFWGYFPVLWTAKRRAVCDLAAGTVVRLVTPTTLARDLPRRARGAQGRGIEPPTTVP